MPKAVYTIKYRMNLIGVPADHTTGQLDVSTLRTALAIMWRNKEYSDIHIEAENAPPMLAKIANEASHASDLAHSSA